MNDQDEFDALHNMAELARRIEFDRVHAIGQRLRKIFERDRLDHALVGLEDYLVRAVEEATNTKE